MTIKDTTIWKKIRLLKNKLLQKKEYHYLSKLKKRKYEDFLISKYSKMMNKFPYSFGKQLNFDNPLTFTEKQQWLKLYDNSETKSILTDKYRVRDFVKKNIGTDYLVPLITINGRDVFDRVKDINFKLLPNSFVIKCTHGSHMNIIVKDKNSLKPFDILKIKNKIKKWLKTNYAYCVGLELHYSLIKPRIIIEEYLDIDNDLPDYKFFCFNGKPEFLWVDQNRQTDHKRSVFDLNYNKLPFNFLQYDQVNLNSKPRNFDVMIEIAKKLSTNFIFSRVDLYNINGKIFFGEITFSSGSGYQAPCPIEYDMILGQKIAINNKIRENNRIYR